MIRKFRDKFCPVMFLTSAGNFSKDFIILYLLNKVFLLLFLLDLVEHEPEIIITIIIITIIIIIIIIIMIIIRYIFSEPAAILAELCELILDWSFFLVSPVARILVLVLHHPPSSKKV